MKFATISDRDGTYIGILTEYERNIIPIKKLELYKNGSSNFPDSLLECIKLGDPFFNQIRTLLNEDVPESLLIPIKDVEWLAPIPRPEKNIFCVGKNYAEHAIEMGSAEDIPEHVMVFTKAPTAVTGHLQNVELHKEITSQLDYEGELAVIIGKRGRGISKENALDFVFGYTILNDITARDLQSRHKQFFLGKSLDTSCPIGPWIVHKSSINNPNQLDIKTHINDELRQSSNTSQFIFDVQEIISVISKGMTLEPGDIIATGTPAGVGKGFKPPRFLKSGDKISISIEGIGTLINRVK